MGDLTFPHFIGYVGAMNEEQWLSFSRYVIRNVQCGLVMQCTRLKEFILKARFTSENVCPLS